MRAMSDRDESGGGRGADAAEETTERLLEEFFDAVRERTPVSAEIWTSVERRIEASQREGAVSGSMRFAALRLGHRRWIAAAVLAVVLLAGSLLVVELQRGGGVANAEAILQQAQTTITSPSSAGIRSLTVTETITVYFLSGGNRGRPAMRFTVNGWYDAPRHQRIESQYITWNRDGSVNDRGSSTYVWDGTHFWSYDARRGQVDVYDQAARDPYAARAGLQGLLGSGGNMGSASYLVVAEHCRSATVSGKERVDGREAYRIALGPRHCGFTLPGADGPSIVWIDVLTGLPLKQEWHSVDGSLAGLSASSLEINSGIDASRFTFAPPSGTAVTRHSGAQQGVRTSSWPPPWPPSISLAAAQQRASFDVVAPSGVPLDFHLVEVEYAGPDLPAQGKNMAHNDWVLLRYEDAQGNWLMVSEGFGGIIGGFVESAPTGVPHGTTRIHGRPAKWIEGSPVAANLWEPGTMAALRWIGDASKQYSVSLASNSLTVAQLEAVAASLP